MKCGGGRQSGFTPTPERPHLQMGDGRRSGRDSAPWNLEGRRAADFNPRGFTIIELILGLGIFVAMALSVYLIYANALRIESESRKIGDLSAESYWALKSIGDDLENMIPYRYKNRGSDDEQLAFDGEKDSMAFVIEGEESLQWVSFRLDFQPSGKAQQVFLGERRSKNENQIVNELRGEKRKQMLTRRIIPFKGLPPVDTDPASSEILTNQMALEGLSFYYAGNAEKKGPSWRNQWHDLNPPAVVRVVLRMVDTSSARVLEFTKDILVPVGK